MDKTYEIIEGKKRSRDSVPAPLGQILRQRVSVSAQDLVLWEKWFSRRKQETKTPVDWYSCHWTNTQTTVSFSVRGLVGLGNDSNMGKSP